ncbi:hypothetical protein B0T17DRAFT_70718 [Bombardia bombarda]|uniref:Uncharacterized protein n=1 Tax=Bombardia bombarda TaxID=252184 RepID=A0AA39XM79_9PEZI|nr:hypothetical protein B0T17DRAFT_70718 [Bombardia bombarda]
MECDFRECAGEGGSTTGPGLKSQATAMHGYRKIFLRLLPNACNTLTVVQSHRRTTEQTALPVEAFSSSLKFSFENCREHRERRGRRRGGRGRRRRRVGGLGPGWTSWRRELGVAGEAAQPLKHGRGLRLMCVVVGAGPHRSQTSPILSPFILPSIVLPLPFVVENRYPRTPCRPKSDIFPTWDETSWIECAERNKTGFFMLITNSLTAGRSLGASRRQLRQSKQASSCNNNHLFLSLPAFRVESCHHALASVTIEYRRYSHTKH